MGKAIGELHWVYEEDAERVTAISSDMLNGKSSRNLHENRNYRKDGSVIDCEWYNSALRDTDGNLISIQSQVLDVTGRNRTAQALQESERFLQGDREDCEARRLEGEPAYRLPPVDRGDFCDHRGPPELPAGPHRRDEVFLAGRPLPHQGTGSRPASPPGSPLPLRS